MNGEYNKSVKLKAICLFSYMESYCLTNLVLSINVVCLSSHKHKINVENYFLKNIAN